MMIYPILPIAFGAITAFIGATLVGLLAVSVGFPLPPSNRRIGCIDGLRGYLALSVLVHHFVIWVQVTRLAGTWSAPTINILNNLGAGGVALFFMTTGLVFYPRILKGFRTTSWVATYTTRVFRIIPLVAISVLIITLIIMARTGNRPGFSFPKQAAEWITAWSQPSLLDYPDTGRINAYVLWSLWYEWLFYILVLPSCALAMDLIRGKLPSWTVPTALLLFSLVIQNLQFLHNFNLHGIQNLPQFIPLFAIGMLAYEVHKSSTLNQLLQRPISTIFAVISLTAGMASAPTPYEIPQLCLFAFFFIAVACGNNLAGLLRTKGALALGECSYGIYLLHGIALSLLFVDGSWLVNDFTADQIFVLLPIVALIIACVTPLTYTLIERPMIAMGSRTARRLTGRKIREDSPQAEVVP